MPSLSLQAPIKFLRVAIMAEGHPMVPWFRRGGRAPTRGGDLEDEGLWRWCYGIGGEGGLQHAMAISKRKGSGDGAMV